MSAQDSDRLGGTITFDDGSSMAFEDLRSLIFTIADGAESIPQNVNEWPREYDPGSRSRSAPLRWLRSIDVIAGERRAPYRCLFEPEVEITTVTGVTFRSRYATLEWIKVSRTAAPTDLLHVYFAGENGREVRRIDLD